MSTVKSCTVSVVVPVYNESAGLPDFNASLLAVLKRIKVSFEVLYVDDGSSDDSLKVLNQLHKQNSLVKVLRLSRNFGKEYALTAGILRARGEAIITIDADGQHPVELVPEFLAAWKQGAQVVVGVRQSNQKEGWFKRTGSLLFYSLFNRLTGHKQTPGSSDFRLISRSVQRAFAELSETDRMTRSLIDWLGFERVYVPFHAKARESGQAGYDRRKLIRLAAHGFVSMSPKPLYIFAVLGIVITCLSLVLGLAVLFEQVIGGDPLHWHFTGTAMLGILNVFLVGLLLMSQGIISLYISHTHNQTKRRPLYVIDYDRSLGVSADI